MNGPLIIRLAGYRVLVTCESSRWFPCERYLTPFFWDIATFLWRVIDSFQSMILLKKAENPLNFEKKTMLYNSVLLTVVFLLSALRCHGFLPT